MIQNINPVQNSSGGFLSKIGGGLAPLIGTGLGAALAVPTGGLSVPAGAALGSTIGGEAGNAIGAIDQPKLIQSSALQTSQSNDLNSQLNQLYTAKGALTASNIPQNHYESINKHLTDAITAIQTRQSGATS